MRLGVVIVGVQRVNCGGRTSLCGVSGEGWQQQGVYM